MIFKIIYWKKKRVKQLRTQNKVYCDAERELTKNDYLKLLKAAEGNVRLQLILQIICGTGIRILKAVFSERKKVDIR